MHLNNMLVFHLLSFSSLASARPQNRVRQTAALNLLQNQLQGTLIPIQQQILNYLNRAQSSQDFSRLPKSPQCAMPGQPLIDKCCVWYDVSAELTSLFLQPNGQCNDNAHGAVRFAFHDAGSWDQFQTHGGADGSLMMDFGEINRPENNGLQSIRLILRSLQAKYKVGYADLAQYAHNHAVVTCPKGPSIRTFIGRRDATQVAPDGLMPNTHATGDSLVALMADKGIGPEDLAALLGAHTAGRQSFVDTSATAVNKPFDTTVGIWDVQFYNDTLNNQADSSATQKIFVLPSDKVLSQHPAVSEEWHKYVGNQTHWNEDYAKAAIVMGLLGVLNTANLTDCTRTLPQARPNGV